MKQGWEYKKLGDVCDTINGLWTGKKPPFININVISLKNFTKDCKLRKDSFTPIEAEVRHFEKRKLQYGDIIVEKSGGSDTQPVGRPVFFDIIDGNYSFCNFTSTLRIKEGISLSPRYLYDALLWCYKRGDTFKLQSKTTGIHNLDLKGYLNLRIPLPPLSEQQSIVAELDKINEIIDLKKAQLKDLDLLAQSIFYEMFGDPIENPKGWEVKRIEECAEKSKHALKAGPFGSALKKEFYVTSGYKIYGQEQVIANDPNYGDYYINEERYEALKNCAVKEGDILISLVGTFGKLLIIPKNHIPGIINPRLVKLSLNKDLIDVTFFKAFFTSESLKKFLDNESHGQTMGILNLGIIKSIKTILPPLSLQQSFAEKIQAIESQKSAIKQSLADVETLLASRMDYYFN